jgi:hypothetical protein
MKNHSKELNQYLSSIVNIITKDDPIRQRWFSDYLLMRMNNRVNFEPLSVFCDRMERDKKISDIFNI